MARRSASSTKHRGALVTGASSGIGAAFATRLARDGFDVTIVARSEERLRELSGRLHREHGTRITVLPADLTHTEDLRRVEDHIAADPALKLLINNAGFGTVGRFCDLDPAKEEEEIRLNVLALVRLTRAALPGMVERGGGSIINVSSMAGFQPGPFTATYNATKAYVNSFTEAVSEEVRTSGVRLQVLCPGFTRTEFQARANVDTTSVPSFAWMSAEQVVDASLSALERGKVVCVPGIGNRLVVGVVGSLPGGVVRRVAGVLGQRIQPGQTG